MIWKPANLLNMLSKFAEGKWYQSASFGWIYVGIQFSLDVSDGIYYVLCQFGAPAPNWLVPSRGWISGSTWIWINKDTCG